ncbi:MAG TPA: hypothetical protein VNY06_08135, partial [Methylocella sp.]|nr:hypothetical protein [Methylocella sp.]
MPDQMRHVRFTPDPGSYGAPGEPVSYSEITHKSAKDAADCSVRRHSARRACSAVNASRDRGGDLLL